MKWQGRLLAGPARRGDGARRLLEAIRPKLIEWVQRGHGTLTFRLTQILTGHGCFGRYLHHVARRETSPACHQCDCAEDTAQHALESCPGGAELRSILTAVVGPDLTLSSVIIKMIDDERSWGAMVSFCETLMSQREIEEREREINPLSLSIRRKRTRRRASRARSQSPLGLGALDA